MLAPSCVTSVKTRLSKTPDIDQLIMATSDEKPNFAVSEEDIAEATRTALGPKAVLESYESSLIQEPGVGLLGIHFFINAQARSAPGQPIVDIPMFAKMLPPVSGPAHFLKAFPNECAFLKKLQGPLDEVLKSPDGAAGPRWSPKCYLAKDDLVIFENMGALGYKGPGQHQEVPIEYYQQVCKALARLHAGGLLFAHKNGREAATEVCPELKDNVLFSNDYNSGGVHVRNSTVDALSSALILMLTPEEKPRLKELQEKLAEMSRSMMDTLNQANTGPLVPQHGDCHLNNFLFKFDDEGNPIDAVLIDFQLARFALPALDLCFFIFLAASAEFAKKHWDELFQIYYENLAKETARCGVDIHKILTFEDLLAGAGRIRKIALLMACMYSTVMAAPRMELGMIMLDPFDYRRFLLGCRSAEVLRWFDSEPTYRVKIEKMLREILDL